MDVYCYGQYTVLNKNFAAKKHEKNWNKDPVLNEKTDFKKL